MRTLQSDCSTSPSADAVRRLKEVIHAATIGCGLSQGDAPINCHSAELGAHCVVSACSSGVSWLTMASYQAPLCVRTSFAQKKMPDIWNSDAIVRTSVREACGSSFGLRPPNAEMYTPLARYKTASPLLRVSWAYSKDHAAAGRTRTQRGHRESQ